MRTNEEPDSAADLVRRWEASGAAERANYQLFLSELCDVLDVPRPDPAVVQFHNGDGTTSLGRIDLYKKGCFVLEAKQGSNEPMLPRARRAYHRSAIRDTPGWDEAMLAARYQAEQYAKAIPDDRSWSSWMSGTALNYTPIFPSPAKTMPNSPTETHTAFVFTN